MRTSLSPNGRQALSPTLLRGIRQRLLYWQERQGYRSQAEFAERSGIAVSTLKGWMAKKPKAPDLATLYMFADKQGLSFDWLLYGCGPELRDLTRPIAELEAEVRVYCVQACATGDLSRFTKAISEHLPPARQMLDNFVMASRERLNQDLAARARAMREAALEYLREKAARLNASPHKESEVPLFVFKGVLQGVLANKEFSRVACLVPDEFYDNRGMRASIAERLPEITERHERELTAGLRRGEKGPMSAHHAYLKKARADR